MILQAGTNSSLKGSIPAEVLAEADEAAIKISKPKIKTRCAENWRAFDSSSSSTHLSLRTAPLSFAYSSSPIVIREHRTRKLFSQTNQCHRLGRTDVLEAQRKGDRQC